MSKRPLTPEERDAARRIYVVVEWCDDGHVHTVSTPLAMANEERDPSLVAQHSTAGIITREMFQDEVGFSIDVEGCTSCADAGAEADAVPDQWARGDA